MKKLLLLAVVLFSGCATVGPEYARPDVGVSEADSFASVPAGAVPSPQDLRWWLRFGDPLMSKAIEEALAGNLDIEIAFEQVEQAGAILRGAQARRGFVLEAEAGAGGEYRRSSNGDGGRNGQSGRRGADAVASAGLAFDWNADLWGGLRQAEKSAAASLMRTQDLVQAARLATAGLAARGYVAWLQAQHELALLQKALVVRQETVHIAQVRVDAGLAPTLDLARAQADLNAVQADLDDAAGRVRQAALALQILAGRPPLAAASAFATMETVPPLPDLDDPLPVPRPIDLLRLRPDVRAAEHALVRSFAGVGVAQAALYPQLTLPGELLLTGSGLGTGSIARTLTASLSALLQVPLFDGGQRSAEVDIARAIARETSLVYRRTVLKALEQVEHALIANRVTRSQRNARQAAVGASETALVQADVLYREGLTSFLDYLEAQRTLLSNRLELVRTKADAVRAAISLFEATGLIVPVDTKNYADRHAGAGKLLPLNRAD